MIERSTFETVLRVYWGLFVLGTFTAHLLGYYGTQEATLYLVFAAAMMVFNND